MNALSRVGTLVYVALMLAGCSNSVEGSAAVSGRSPADAQARVRPLEQVLPDAAELSVAVGSPMKIYEIGRPGGLEVLPNGMKEASPIECLGVASPRMHITYEPVPVTAAIDADWTTVDDGGPHFPDPDFHITIGVIELDSPANARHWYSQFASQWQQCQGQSVTTQSALANEDRSNVAEINRVSDAEGMLSAVVLRTAGYSGNDDPLVKQRALTAASRYIIDVGITRIAVRTSNHTTSDDAVAVARLIAKKIVSTE